MARRFVLPILGLVLVVGCQRITINGGVSVTTTAKVMKDEVVAREFETGAQPQVIVEIFVGSITVERGEEGKVAAEVTKRGGGETEAEALDMLKKLDVQMVQEGDKVRITAKVPAGERYVGEAPARLKVPAGAKLDLRSSFNDVNVTGIKGPIDAKSSNGNLTIRDGAGELKLNTSFGKIDVDSPAAAVQATTSNCEITIKQAKGPQTLKSSFGNIRTEPAGGGVNAETSNGNIQIRGAMGRVLAKSSFGNIEIDGESAAVNAETSNGTIAFVGSLAETENVFKSSFGHIALTLPADAQFQLDAKTSFGVIKTGYTLAKSTTTSKTHLAGTVGTDPKTSLTIVTSNGNVVVNPGK
jgi:DUF4097 and DUF4098 domain-containing protein YvlB